VKILCGKVGNALLSLILFIYREKFIYRFEQNYGKVFKFLAVVGGVEMTLSEHCCAPSCVPWDAITSAARPILVATS
jgi:hypothetical protein